MRIFARLEKGAEVRFVSHLDMQRLIQRALRRAGVPMEYSNGFNPHPQLSFATALPVGQTSCAEWVDVRLTSDMSSDELMMRLNATLPVGYTIREAFRADDRLPALSAMMQSGEYTVRLDGENSIDALQNAVDKLMSAPIMVEKRTKGGLKTVDIRPQVYSVIVTEADRPTLKITGQLDAGGSLSVDKFLEQLSGCVEKPLCVASVCRDWVNFSNEMQPYAAF